MAMSSVGKSVATVLFSKSDKLDWIDWLCVTYPTHSRNEIQEFYISRYGSVDAAKSAIDEYRSQVVGPAGSSLRHIGVRYFLWCLLL